MKRYRPWTWLAFVPVQGSAAGISGTGEQSDSSRRELPAGGYRCGASSKSGASRLRAACSPAWQVPTLLWILGMLLWPACASVHDPKANACGPTATSAPNIPALRASPPSEPWPLDEGLGAYSYGKHYWVNVLPPPAGIPLNEEFELVLRIVDGATRSHVVEHVPRVDARMPGHGHGMKQDPVVERAADGSWRVSGLLWHMVGYWELYVDLPVGVILERAQFAHELE